MNWILPLPHLREMETLLAFFHPRPSYEFHILLVAKRPYQNLIDLERDPDGMCFHKDLVSAVVSLVKEYQLEEKGYRLITNGGPFQEIAVLHYHLVSGKPLP